MKMIYILRPSLILMLIFTAWIVPPTTISAKKDDGVKEALQMKRYDKDTSASAVIISDVGRSYFNFSHPRFGLELVFERKVMVKIFDADGYGWADFFIPLYVGDKYEEEALELKGFTYNLDDGKVEKTKLSKESIFHEETSEHWKQEKITMPDVREGSVFEISYKVSSPFIFNLQSWTFQKSIPVIESEYQTEIPEYFQYNKNMRGYFPIAGHETNSRLSTIGGRQSNNVQHLTRATQSSTPTINYTENIEKWIAYDVPAFRDEPYMTDADNFKTAITFELAYTKFPNSPAENYTTSWEDINRKLMDSEDFGDALDRTGFLKSVLPEALGDASTDEAKIASIYHYIHTKVKWNEKNSLFVSQKLKSTLEEGAGNSADINLLFIAMLRESGVKVYPVALSTRSHGMIFPTNPTITSFNYLLAGIDRGDQYFLMDATEPFAPPGILPFRCLNGAGRLINEQGGQWIEVASKSDKEKTIAEYTFDLDEENVAGNHSHIYYDQSAYGFRHKFSSEDATEAFKEDMEESVPGLDIQSVNFVKVKELGEAPSVICEITLNDAYNDAGGMIYFNPLFFDALKSNPFKLEKRDYPVDYGTQADDFYYAKINLPKGYTVESVPKEIDIVLPGKAAEYIYSAKAVGEIISVRSQLKINQTIFTADQYADLKNFYDLVVKKQAEQIVLKKA